MPTTQQEFQDVAYELLKVEFADFLFDATFTIFGDYVPGSGTTETDSIVEAIREDYNESQFDGQSIQRNDFKLLALDVDFIHFKPNVGNIKVSVKGVDCDVINAYLDAANAMWIIQVRG